jgi:hypothetical protein
VSGLILLFGLAACRASEASRKGHLEARWTGPDSGRLSGGALAEWCDEQRRLEIRTIEGDTGLAVAVFPDVVLSPDSYRVVAPGSKDSTAPSARVALRYFGRTTINGFQGDSGTVVLEHTDSGQLTGYLAARGTSVSNSERVRISGKFQDLPVVPQGRGCTADSMETDSEPADTERID